MEATEMSINRCTAKYVGGVCVYIHAHIHTYNGILLSHKDEIMTSTTIRIDLEIIIISQTKINIISSVQSLSRV